MFAPGVGTPVPGGLSYREAHLTLELVAESELLDSLELVEVNPILDRAERDRRPRRRAGRERSRRADPLSRTWGLEQRRASDPGWRTTAHDLDWSRRSEDCSWRAAGVGSASRRGHDDDRAASREGRESGLEAAEGLLPHGRSSHTTRPRAQTRSVADAVAQEPARREGLVRLEGARAEALRAEEPDHGAPDAAATCSRTRTRSCREAGSPSSGSSRVFANGVHGVVNVRASVPCGRA